MTEKTATVERRVGKCMLHNWAEERAIAALDSQDPGIQTQKYGHRGILTMDMESKMEAVTTVNAVFIPPKSPGVRLRGIRAELLEKNIAQMIREKAYAEMNPPPPKTNFCSTTQKDFCHEGFVALTPETTTIHDYKTEQAVTFWSENCQQVQGVTAVKNPKTPFKKSAMFSTPISERLDEIELLPDN